MVAVAQLVGSWVVIPDVAGSSPVGHTKAPRWMSGGLFTCDL